MIRNPLVSVLIHTRSSQRTIKNLLESIKNQSYKKIEIIMVDNNSKDNTLKIAKFYTTKIFNFGPERSAQRNYAAKKAKGEYLLVPDSDMILGKNVVKECVDLILEKPRIKAIIVPEKSIGSSFWAKCKQLERSYYPGIDWIEGARFFQKKAFDEIGGYDERNTGTEDFDLPQRFRRKYKDESIGRIKELIYHDEGDLSLFYLLKKKFYYAHSISVYKKSNLADYYKQVDVFKRLILFFSKPDKLFADPIVGTGMIFMKTLEFAVGGIGFAVSRNNKT
ncbi:MAG: glycosyltransferase [Candidatus Levybacteria bacterium]|nr:glycosyltransferase [Candidatus Levybacteria bacterium]